MIWAARAGSLCIAGIGCILSFEATAGQLSFAPSVNLTVDDDSDRNLSPDGLASQSASLQFSADIKGSTETTDFTLSPLVRYQYFDTAGFSDIFERDVSLTDAWSVERGKLTLTAEDADHSTITTEATETGILNSRLHQRLDSGGLSYAFDQTERLTLILTGSYTDVSYYGTADSSLLNLLSGYRYPSASVGEQFELSEASTLLANISYSKVLSQLSELDSQNTGGDLEFHQAISERFSVGATIGASEARSETSELVATGSLSLTRSYDLGSVTLSYSRGLSPYGTGNLVQRQVVAASASRSLSDVLSVSLSLSRVQNGEIAIQGPQFGVPAQVQSYDNAQLSCSWQFAENWHLGAEVDTTRTQVLGATSQTVQEWRTALSIGWVPNPLTTQF